MHSGWKWAFNEISVYNAEMVYYVSANDIFGTTERTVAGFFFLFGKDYYWK